MKRQLAILGSTGSIGVQALEVVREHRDLFEVYALTANDNVNLITEQVREFSPEVVVIANEGKYGELKEALKELPVKVWAGEESIAQVVGSEGIDMVVTALVGYAGLKPTLSAIRAGKAIALANKETMVVAGELVTSLAIAHQVPLLPIDSEHSAIFQCLAGSVHNPVEKIILTASGGPFRTKTLEELGKVTKSQALKHPNWSMGVKISIDSASMMNKGFEMIEARWLFGIKAEKIEVVVHPESVIHSMVQFEDGAVMAQLGIPDMRIPIAYALNYPHRLKNSLQRLDLTRYGALTFEMPDMNRFPNLKFAYEAIEKGGNMPCILNAANEIAVEAFLQEEISFVGMSRVIEQTMLRADFLPSPVYEDYVSSDAQARRLAKELL